MGTVRPPSPESAVDSSRKDALSGESVVVGSSATSGLPGPPSRSRPRNHGPVRKASLSYQVRSIHRRREQVRSAEARNPYVPLTAPDRNGASGVACCWRRLARWRSRELLALRQSLPRCLSRRCVPGPRQRCRARRGRGRIRAVEVASEGAEAQPGSFAAVQAQRGRGRIRAGRGGVGGRRGAARPLRPVPGATVVAVASVPVGVASEGVELHPAASGSCRAL